MSKQAAKKSDDITKGTNRKIEPKAVFKKAKKAKGIDPNVPKRPASGFFIFMETFRKAYKDANPEAKRVAVVGKAGGEKWKEMSDEEKAAYNIEAEARKATYDQAMIKYKNKDSSKVDGEVFEDAAEDEQEVPLTKSPSNLQIMVTRWKPRVVLALPAVPGRRPMPERELPVSTGILVNADEVVREVPVIPVRGPNPRRQPPMPTGILAEAEEIVVPVALPPPVAPTKQEAATPSSVTSEKPDSRDVPSFIPPGLAAMANKEREPESLRKSQVPPQNQILPPSAPASSVACKPKGCPDRPKVKRFLMVLELEGVLCRTEYNFEQLMNPLSKHAPPSEESYKSWTPTPFAGFSMYWRPYLRQFLKFLVQNFHVAVWTRLPRSVALEMVDFLFHGLHYPVQVLGQESCTRLVETRPWSECPCPSIPCTDGLCRGHPISLGLRRDPLDVNETYLKSSIHPHRELLLKVLHKVVFVVPPFRASGSAAWFQPNPSNTLLVDCSPESSILNPVFNAIFPLAYWGTTGDSTLKFNLKRYLKGLAAWVGSVPEYLNSRGPYFGEMPIRLSESIYGIKVYLLAIVQDRSLVLPYPYMTCKYRMTEGRHSVLEKGTGWDQMPIEHDHQAGHLQPNHFRGGPSSSHQQHQEQVNDIRPGATFP